MRIAVLSDIHANSVALDAVLADAGEVDAVWHLGDVVGYGPDPDGVVERLRDISAKGVRGNHDAAAIGSLDIDAFNPDARAAIEWTRRRIGRQTHAWLEELPVRSAHGEMTLVHGSPRDPIWEYVVSVGIARENLPAFATPHCLHGHTHVPILFRDGGGRRMEMLSPEADATMELDERRVMLNPGSVGQPRDGLPTASYLILEPEARRCSWRRVAYDIAAVQRDMEQAGLPVRLIARLQFGL